MPKNSAVPLLALLALPAVLAAQVVAPGEGLPIWNFNAGAVVYSSPCVAYGKVFAGAGSDRFICVDLSNGQLSWEFKTGNSRNAFLASPCVLENRVFAAAYQEKKMFALDAMTGSKIWEFKASGEIESSPRVRDGKVYFGTMDGQFVCLDAATGEKIWSTSVRGNIRSSAYLYGGLAVFGTSDRRVTCLETATGKKVWEFDAGGTVLSSPAGDDQFVYVGSQSRFTCLSLSNGRKIWEFKAGDQILSSPFLYYGKVYFGSSDDKLYCLQASNGQQVWQFKAGDNIQSSPSVVDEKVYFGSYDRQFYCLSASTGEKLWSFSAASGIESSPSVVDGKVYFGADDSNLYCLEAGSIEFTAGNTLSGQDYAAIKEEEDNLLLASMAEEFTDDEPLPGDVVEQPDLALVDTNETVMEESPDAAIAAEEEQPVVEAPPVITERVVYHYTVQVGAFVKKSNANALVRRLEKKDYEVYTRKFTLKKKKFTRVRIGRFVSFEEAYALKSALRDKGIRGIIVRY